MIQTSHNKPSSTIPIQTSFPKDFIIAIDGFSCTGKGVTSRLVAKRLGLNYIDTGSMYRAYCLFFIGHIQEIVQKINQYQNFSLSTDFQKNTELFEDFLHQVLDLARLEIYPPNHDFSKNKKYQYNLKEIISKLNSAQRDATEESLIKNSTPTPNSFESTNIINSQELLQKLNNLDLKFDYCSDSGESELMLNGVFLKNQIRTPLIDKLVPIVAKIHYVREVVSSVQKAMKGVVMEGRDIGTVIFPNADLKVFMTASLEVRAIRRQLDYQKKGIEVELSEVSKSLQERDKQDMERESCPLVKAEEALLLDTTFTTIDEQVQKIIEWSLERAGVN